MSTQNKFQALLIENNGIVHSAIDKYCNRDEWREDLFQEIALRAWSAYQKFREDSKFSTWLYSIAKNTCIDTLRRTGTKIKTVAIDNFLYEIADEQYEEVPLPVIDSLSKIEKLTLDLYIDGKSYKEIARQTGETDNKIAVRMFRIKERLKNKRISNK